jgi:hypothetical protein
MEGLMNANDAICQMVDLSHMVTRAYIEDLSDADLTVRSVPGATHIAWQLGHLIVATQQMLGLLGRPAPDLPAGFEAAHGREAATSDDPARFASKEQYLALADQMPRWTRSRRLRRRHWINRGRRRCATTCRRSVLCYRC